MNNKALEFSKLFPSKLEAKMSSCFDPDSMSVVVDDEDGCIGWHLRWNIRNRGYQFKGKIATTAIVDMSISIPDYLNVFVDDIIKNAIREMNETEGKEVWSQ